MKLFSASISYHSCVHHGTWHGSCLVVVQLCFVGKKKVNEKITLYNNVLLFCFCCAQLFTFEKKHGRINFYSVLAPFLVLSSGLVNEKFVTSNYVLGRKAKIQNHAKVEWSATGIETKFSLNIASFFSL